MPMFVEVVTHANDARDLQHVEQRSCEGLCKFAMWCDCIVYEVIPQAEQHNNATILEPTIFLCSKTGRTAVATL